MRVLTRSDIKSIREVRLVGSSGTSEIVPVLDAWKQAELESLDLILVSKDDAVPLVVRIQDYKKLMFERKKAKTQSTKVKKKNELKEIQLKANISDHDLQTKVNNIDKFLLRGDKVKILVRLKGRERENPKRAFELLEKVVETVSVPCKFSKLNGPIASGILEPGQPTK